MDEVGMKILFIEHATKIPQWTYAGTPSYLFDPERVIDPTAYGAMCTAAGMHCDHSELIGMNHAAPEAVGEYASGFDVVVYAIRYSCAAMLTAMARTKGPIVLVGMCLGIDELKKSYQSQLQPWCAMMREANAVLCFHHAFPHYLSYFTDTPVYYLPFAYPYSFVKDTVRQEEKQNCVLMPGVVWNGRDGGRRDDVLSTILAARHAEEFDMDILISDRMAHAEYQGKSTAVLDWAGVSFDESRVTLLPSMKWIEFLMAVRHCRVAFHLDWSLTTGRMAADMAALGIPTIGGNSDHQTQFFPELSVSEEGTHEVDRIASDVHHNGTQRYTDSADAYGKSVDYYEWWKQFERIIKNTSEGLS